MERMPDRAEDSVSRLQRNVVAVAAAALFAVGACAAPGGGATSAPPTPVPATGAPGSPAAAALTLELAQDATLGSYVAGKDGKALYIFTPDTGGASNCNDDCAANWPPLTVTMADNAAAAIGVTGELGTIARADGALQITLGGHPLYYFKNDLAAGDVKGQGLNDVWYLAGPDGSGVGAPAGGPGASDAPETTPCPPADRTCY